MILWVIRQVLDLHAQVTTMLVSRAFICDPVSHVVGAVIHMLFYNAAWW